MFPVEPVPERIGAYQVLKHVGRSGAADVYTARMDGPLGFTRDVTLKLVEAGVEDDARFAEELAREAAICARLNHPVVVRMFDFFEYGSRLVLVLEQVEGCSLEKLTAHVTRRKQRLSDGGIFYLASQLGAALAHAHASSDEDGNLSPVIHRDLKPENVLIGWDGNVRLAGFGLGKILGRTPDFIAGTVRGTPGYMSPEQARGERATVRSDVYGFGVLLWSLLTGREPPTDGVRIEPLASIRPDLPRELLAAVDAALEPSPDKRRITCAEIAQWLGKLTKPEAGREELRQKVLWLRATRGPASKLDTTNTTPRIPKRRQAVQATRPSVRRPGGPASSRPPSSYGPPSSRTPPSQRAPGSLRVPPLHEDGQRPSDRVPPPLPPPPPRQERELPPAPATARPGAPYPGTGHPLTGTMQMPAVGSQAKPPDAGEMPTLTNTPRVQPRSQPKSSFPTSRPGEDPTPDVLMRLPPPPPLPASSARNGQSRPASSDGAPKSNGAAPPSSGRPASNVNVRTVSATPPPRTVPPAFRHAVPAEDLLAIGPPPSSWDTDVSVEDEDDFRPRALARIESPTPTNTNGGVALPNARRGPDTLRPGKPQQVTLSMTMQLLLAVITAALVVTVGLLLQGRSSQASSAPPPQVVTVEVNRNDPNGRSDGRGSEAEATASAIAAVPVPSATADPAAHTPASDNYDELPETMGYLTVKGPANSDVYINGVRRGPTNERLMVACGNFFLRLAPKDAVGFYKPWSSLGQSVIVECKGNLTVTARLPPPPPPEASSAQGTGL